MAISQEPPPGRTHGTTATGSRLRATVPRAPTHTMPPTTASSKLPPVRPRRIRIGTTQSLEQPPLTTYSLPTVLSSPPSRQASPPRPALSTPTTWAPPTPPPTQAAQSSRSSTTIRTAKGASHRARMSVNESSSANTSTKLLLCPT